MVERDGVVWRIESHAIVSREGYLADANGDMPSCLHVEEDQRRFQAALSRATATIVGRMGHERHPAGRRRRLVLTSRANGIETRERVTFWNPDMASFADALAVAAPEGGTVANAGGPRVMAALLPVTDAFDLVVATRCSIDGGLMCLPGEASIESVRRTLVQAGLHHLETMRMDGAGDVVLHRHARDPV